MFQMTYKKPSFDEIRVQNNRYHINYIKTLVMSLYTLEISNLRFS